jgi:hypothetical protein
MRDAVRIRLVVAAIVAVLGLPVGVAGADEGDRLKRAVDALRRAQMASGLLRYDFDFIAGQSSDQNDPVRQAGVVAFLAEYLLASGDVSVTPAVRRALEQFQALSLPIGKGRLQRLVEWTGLLSVPRGKHTLARTLNRLGLLYEPAGPGAVFGLEREYHLASAGATAMGLLAELQYAEATGDQRFAALRERWLLGLAALHVPGLGFRISPTMVHVSPFADGEAWLTLAYHQRHQTKHPVVGSMLDSLEERLMRQYEGQFSIAFYQWGTMAAAVRWDATRRPRFLSFIERQAMDALTWLSTPRPGNTCATVEGLAAAAGVLREAAGHTDLLARLDQRIADEMRKNYGYQILKSRGRIDVGQDAYLVSRRLEEFDGAFVHEQGRPYTRIDFTGHCLSAMVKLQYGSGRRGARGR